MKKSSSPALYGSTNPSPAQTRKMRVKRFGAVIGLKPAMEREYRKLHANAWHGIIARLRKSHIHNYSIFITAIGGRKYLFSYFEYTGTDMKADMDAIARDPLTQRWWKKTDPCQIPLSSRKPGAHWSDMEQVFFMK